MPGKQSFDPIDKPQNLGKGKPPTHHGGSSYAGNNKNGIATSNGVRSNSFSNATGTVNQNYPGMAESLRAQIATPRNN